MLCNISQKAMGQTPWGGTLPGGGGYAARSSWQGGTLPGWGTMLAGGLPMGVPCQGVTLGRVPPGQVRMGGTLPKVPPQQGTPCSMTGR